MEYGEAVTPEAFDRAVAIGRAMLRKDDTPLGEIALAAVSQAYCVCVTDGEDAAERRLSDVHQRLVETVAEFLAGERAESGSKE
jgi:hypothetical protein